jgi:hypothetical protein
MRAAVRPGEPFAAIEWTRDVTPATVPIVRITGSTPSQAGLPGNFQGAVVDRVVEIPQRLVR